VKIFLALALLATLACAAVVVDGGYRSGLDSGLPVRGGYGGYGDWNGYRGSGYEGLRGGLGLRGDSWRGDSWRGDFNRGDVIRGDAWRGDLGFGGAYDGAWNQGWSVRDEPSAWRDVNNDGIVDWRDDFQRGGVRPWSGDWARADWNRDGVIDNADGWRRLDATWAAGAWDPAYTSGYRPEVSSVRSVPVGGVYDNYGVSSGPWDTLGWGGSYDGFRGYGLRGDVVLGDSWRGDSWRGDGLRDSWRGDGFRDSWRGDALVGDAWRGDTWRGDSWRGDGLVGDAWRGDSWRGDGLVGDSWRGDSWRGDGFRGDLGWNGARAGQSWEVPMDRSFGYGNGFGYETGLNGYRSGYGSGSWDRPVVRGDSWRGDSWRGDGYRGDWGYESAPTRVVQAGQTTQAKVVGATKPATTTTTKAKVAK
jgi:hypothetical protein